MLIHNIIHPVAGQWKSQFVSALNQDGSTGFCFDYLKLNVVTVPVSNSVPLNEETIDSSGKVPIVSTSDANVSYWQTQFDAQDGEKHSV